MPVPPASFCFEVSARLVQSEEAKHTEEMSRIRLAPLMPKYRALARDWSQSGSEIPPKPLIISYNRDDMVHWI